LTDSDRILPGRGGAEGVVEVVDRKDVADAFLVDRAHRGMEVEGRGAAGLLAVEEVVDLDPQNDGELAAADRGPRLRGRPDDPEPAVPGPPLSPSMKLSKSRPQRAAR
jgi:hypothetical protein